MQDSAFAPPNTGALSVLAESAYKQLVDDYAWLCAGLPSQSVGVWGVPPAAGGKRKMVFRGLPRACWEFLFFVRLKMVGAFLRTSALMAWLALLALAANNTTWASSADAAKFEPDARPYDVQVQGGPEFVDEHSQLMLPGKYLATLFLKLTRQQVSNAASRTCGSIIPRASVTALRRGFNIQGCCLFLKLRHANQGVACCSRAFRFSLRV